jgi:multiple sugar transport system substrate-binding protein
MNDLESSSSRASIRAYCRPFLVICIGLMAGCSSSGSNPQDGGGQEEVGAVELLIVDDPPLAARIRREWLARGTGELAVRETNSDDLLQSKSLDADALIYPSALMGELAERKLIVPVPEDVLRSETLAWRDVFRLQRMQEATWGEKTYGLPLGSPQLVLYYRADLFDRLGISPPQTWRQYRDVLAQLAPLTAANTGTSATEDPTAAGAGPVDGMPEVPSGNGSGVESTVRFATVEPLGPGWAGQVLLARAAPYARHRNQYSTLFDYTSMRPLIDGPPFVRALEELVAAAEYGPPQPWTITPEASRHLFGTSETAMALSWPTRIENAADVPEMSDPAVGDSDMEKSDPAVPQTRAPTIGIAALPGAVDVYQFLNESWEQRSKNEPQRVPLLAIAGRLGSVTRQTPRSRRAFSVLAWLSGREWSGLIAPSSSATTLFRSTHVPASRAWVPGTMDAATGGMYAELVETTQSSPIWLVSLRVPGRGEYMAALDAAVHRALRKEATPVQALQQAAATWREITDRRGRDRQRDAYQRSIGVAP